ncbi:MAG: KH domain-containing protein [Candidatus Woesebacteria bacterium]|jgi:spoIIIJ-associated protein
MTIKSYLKKFFAYLDLAEDEFDIKINETDSRIEFSLDLDKNQSSLFIGKNGETLKSIEHLLRTIFQDKEEKKIVVDINHYKADKDEKVKDRALRKAQLVLDTAKPYLFFDLNSYERHLIHTVIAESESADSLETVSEDTPEGRVLTIRLKEE